MNYFETNYRVDKPKSIVFYVVLDLLELQNSINLFDGAKLTSNNLDIDEPGKQYYVEVPFKDFTLKTIITLRKIEAPDRFMLSYEYETIQPGGRTKEGCAFFPWKDMTCALTIDEDEDGTKIRTSMYANGVKGILRKIITRIYGIINFFQQRTYNKKTAAYINKIRINN